MTNPERRPTAREASTAIVNSVCLTMAHLTWQDAARLEDVIAAAIAARDLEASQALERALDVVKVVAGWDLFGEHGNLVNAARYAQEHVERALASTPTDPGSAT